MSTTNFPVTISLWRGKLDGKPKSIILNEHSIKYGDNQVSYNDVKAIKYGSLETAVNGRVVATDYTTELLLKNETELKIKFTKPNMGDVGLENAENYATLINILWDKIGDKLLKTAIEELNNNRKVTVANGTILEQGFEYEYIPLLFKKKKRLVTWGNIMRKYDNGFIKIYDKNIGDSSGYCPIAGSKVWNAIILESLIDYLFKEGRCFEFENKKNV
jgi:hypothetical protein